MTGRWAGLSVQRPEKYEADTLRTDRFTLFLLMSSKQLQLSYASSLVQQELPVTFSLVVLPLPGSWNFGPPMGTARCFLGATIDSHGRCFSYRSYFISSMLCFLDSRFPFSSYVDVWWSLFVCFDARKFDRGNDTFWNTLIMCLHFSVYAVGGGEGMFRGDRFFFCFFFLLLLLLLL